MFNFRLYLTLLLLHIISNLNAQTQDSISGIDTLNKDHLLQEIVVDGYKNKYKVSKPSQSLRLTEDLGKIPQNIQVLNQELLLDQQLYSMSDAIARNVSGAARIEEWGDMYTYITMRGSRAAAFRNGMNTSWMYGILSEDMSFVDRVEFVKGPAGFMMSNGEPSGIYNTVTKKPTGLNQGAVSLAVGSFGLVRTTLDVDGVLNKKKTLQYRLNIGVQNNNSFREYESTQRISVAPVVRYNFDDKTTLTLEYVLQKAQLPDLGISYLFSKTGYGSIPYKKTLSDPGIEPTIIEDQNITANLEHVFNEDWKLTTQLSYFDYDQTGSFIWVKNLDELGNTQRIHYSWDAVNEMTFGQAFINGRFKTGLIGHNLLGGLDLSNKRYVADFGQSHILDSIGTFNIYSDGYQAPYYGIRKFDRSLPVKERVGASFLLESTVTSLYLQDELSLLRERLRLTLAGRYTYVKDNNYGTVSENKRFTPRIGLSYSVDSSTNVYALYDQTFVPQTGKLRDGGEVSPLTGNNMEVGVKKDWFEDRWNTSLSLYRIMKNNQVSGDPDNIGGENYVLQFGQTKTEGVEFDIRGEILTGLNLMMNYAFTESKITRTTSKYEKGMLVPGYAKHNINAWMSYRVQQGFLKNIGVSAGIMYMLDRATWWNGNYDGDALPDYFRLDGSVSWAKERLNINLNIYNIMDSYLYNGAHHSSGWYYWRSEAPRNFRLNVAYSF